MLRLTYCVLSLTFLKTENAASFNVAIYVVILILPNSFNKLIFWKQVEILFIAQAISSTFRNQLQTLSFSADHIMSEAKGDLMRCGSFILTFLEFRSSGYHVACSLLTSRVWLGIRTAQSEGDPKGAFSPLVLFNLNLFIYLFN